MPAFFFTIYCLCLHSSCPSCPHFCPDLLLSESMPGLGGRSSSPAFAFPSQYIAFPQQAPSLYTHTLDLIWSQGREQDSERKASVYLWGMQVHSLSQILSFVYHLFHYHLMYHCCFQSYFFFKTSLSFSPAKCTEFECQQECNDRLRRSHLLLSRWKPLIILFLHIMWNQSDFSCLYIRPLFFSHKINSNNSDSNNSSYYVLNTKLCWTVLSTLYALPYLTLSTVPFYYPHCIDGKIEDYTETFNNCQEVFFFKDRNSKDYAIQIPACQIPKSCPLSPTC